MASILLAYLLYAGLSPLLLLSTPWDLCVCMQSSPLPYMTDTHSLLVYCYC
jgi:hypothetical protein